MNLCTRLFSRCINYSLSFVIKYPDKSSLREEGLILVHLIVDHSKEAYGVRVLRPLGTLYPLPGIGEVNACAQPAFFS